MPTPDQDVVEEIGRALGVEYEDAEELKGAEKIEDRDRHLCEEVVQETLVRAILDLSDYDPSRSGGNAFPWLSGLARNEIRRVLNRQKRERHATVGAAVQGAGSLEAIWDRVDR